MTEPKGRRGRTVFVRDSRVLPVVVLVRDDLAALALAFPKKKLATARSIYLAVAELFYSVAVSDPVEATRKDIADYAGVTTRTLDDYVPAMEEQGFLIVERRPNPDGPGNLPNLWAIGRPVEGELFSPPGEVSSEGSSTSDHTRGKKTGDTPETASPLLSNAIDDAPGVPDEMRADAFALLARKHRVDGRVVTMDELAVTAAALAEFNRQSGSEYGLGANCRSIVMRIRERPSYDAAAHVRLVQSAFRIKWWERRGRTRKGRVSPNVIYGHAGVFEQVVQDASDEKKGRPIEDTPARRKRFTRED